MLKVRAAGRGDVCSLSVVSVKWFSRRSVLLHAMALLVVAACLALGWWQLERALSGNTLSWVYTFEWPFFAGYAIYMWWKLLHEGTEGRKVATHDARHQPRTAQATMRRSSRSTTGTSQICTQVTGVEADEARADRGLRSALVRYQIMAYVVGVGLIVLVFIGVPLQYGAGVPQVAQIVGPIHGAMYIVYLASCRGSRQARATHGHASSR